MSDKKVEEFLNISSLEKFLTNYKMRFEDNTCISYWWKNNKNNILCSNDDNCIKIKKQYNLFISLREEQKRKEAEYSYKVCRIRLNLYDEFEKIDNLDKFNKNTSITLSNGQNAYNWFVENQRIIFNPTCESHSKILKQYQDKRRIDVLNNKREAKKNELKEYKYRYLFYSINDINKFDSNYTDKFKDGKSIYLWFVENKKSILNSDLEIFKKIKEQYFEYLRFSSLKEEFLEADIEKFSFDSNLRFSTGAFMYDWFESNMNKILNSNYKLDVKISLQYKEFLGDKNHVKKI